MNLKYQFVTFIGFYAAFFVYSLAHAAYIPETILAQIRREEPIFSEIITKALKQEKLEWKTYRKFRRSVRKAPWFPSLYVGYDHAFKEVNAFSITDNVSVTSSGITVGPDKNDFDQSTNQGGTFRVRAAWKLDELIFSSSRLQVERLGRDLGKNRLNLSNYLFKIYSERRKLLAQYYLIKGKTNSKRVLLREKVLDLTEKLDFFTGGHFSHLWWKGK